MDDKGDARRRGLETSCGVVPWGEVRGSVARILILACGPSLAQIDLESLWDREFDGVYVIAVNRAHDWTARANAFFTLDPNEWFREMLSTRMREGVEYFVAVPDDYGTPNSRWLPHRQCVIDGPTYLRRMTGDGFMHSRLGLSDDPAAIHTGNSAYGALGISYHLCRQSPADCAKKIVILGLDGTRQPYPFGGGGPTGSFSHLPRLFASARPQLDMSGIAVVNGNTRSNVTALSRLHPKAALQWLVEDA